MKTSMITLVVLLSVLALPAAFGQATATQTVNLSVAAVYKISTSGNPGALSIITGTAGSDNLTTVSDATTTYSITQNFGNTVKLTANLDAALASGYTLSVNLASAKGTSLGAKDISNATAGSAVDVVTGINMGADAGQSITYSFAALASAGTLAATTRTVTLTLTN